MAQLQCMDARLDPLSIELYQVNVRVSSIALRQAAMGGFTPKVSPPPPLVASDFEAEDDDDGDDNDAFDDDDASSTDQMSTGHFYPLSIVTKRGSSFGYESSYSQGESQYRTILLGGVLLSEECSKDYMYLFLFSILDTFILVHEFCDYY